MEAQTILKELLRTVTPSMHKVRRQSLHDMILSALSGAALSVTSLGRTLDSNTSEKHQIKRADRLCSNSHLQHEVHSIYSHGVRRLIGAQVQPVILVDWSDLDARKQHFLLRASVAVEGRSLTLYEEVHPLASKEKPATHKQFMATLKAMLPESCRPLIITDAGFRNPWFELVRTLGWDFVGRVRNRTFCQAPSDTEWFPAKALYPQATSRPKHLGEYQLCRSHPMSCQLLVYRKKPQGRKDKTAQGDKARRNSHSRKQAAREKEPWLLVTSLTPDNGFSKRVVKLYQTRMQIEESFRDLKTGLNMNLGDTRILKRLKVLLVIALLAQTVLYLLGMTVKMANHHRRYQANSVKYKNVLSYQFIGLRAFKDKKLILGKNDWLRAINQIQQLMREPLYV